MRLELPSRLTMQEATAVLGGLQETLSRSSGPTVHLDAAALGELDTAAIAVLLQCRRLVQARGMALSLDAVPPQLAALMSLYGVAELFGVQV